MSVDENSDQYNSGESIFNDEGQKIYPIMKVSFILMIKNVIALIICFAGQQYPNFYNLVYTNQPQVIIIMSFICVAILYLVQRDNSHGLILSFIYKLTFFTCYIQIVYSFQVTFSYEMIQPLLIAILIGPMSVFLTSLRKQHDINYLTNSLWLSTLCLIFMVSKLKDLDEMTLLQYVTVAFINGCYMMSFMLEKFKKSLIPKYENDEIFIQNIFIESLTVYSKIFDLILDCIQAIGGF